MKILLMAIAAVLLVAGCTTPSTKRQPQQSVDIGSAPDDRSTMFDKLKVYRSYFQIQLESKTAEQFEIWYETADNGWDTFQMAVQADEKFATILDDRRLSDNQATAGWPQPPKKLVRPPRELEGVAQRIINAVPKTFPKDKIKNILITYMGRAARIVAFQYVPTAPHDAKQPYRRGSTAEKHYLVNTKTGKFKEFGGASSGGGSLREPYSKTTPTSWVYVVLPKEAEGNPILGLNFFDQPGEIPSCMVAPIKSAEKQVMKAIANRVREMESGLGLASDQILAKLLAAQGNDLVPQGLEQKLEINASVYGRSASGGNEVDSSVKISTPIQANSVINYTDAKSGIDFTINLDLANKNISVMARRDGHTAQGQSALFEIKSMVSNGQTFLQTDVEAIDRISLDLPGSGKVTNYDIFFGRMSPSDFLIPAGSSCQ